jgi:hypothetical protein
VCWTEVELSQIDPNLTQAGMGTRKGLFQSTQAVKFPYTGIFDRAGNVTLLGLVQTGEGPSPGSWDRSYIFQTYNDPNATPVPTTFAPYP